jgi:hypothetical protein
VSFRKAVEATPNLQGAWRAGLQALRARDRPHVIAEDTRCLQGSVNIDGALEDLEPDAHRWDFAVAYRHNNRKTDCIYWVEVHTANDHELKVVLEKLKWLKQWLANDGQELNAFERDIVWVSSGATSFTQGSPQVKGLAARGLLYAGRVLRISLGR